MEKQEDHNFDKISKLLADELRKGKKLTG